MTSFHFTFHPGPHSLAVSGGIPGTPSSDALRAQKYGDSIGRDRTSVRSFRKSLQAANSNSNRGPSSRAAYAGEVFPPPFASPATQFYSPWKTKREGFWL